MNSKYAIPREPNLEEYLFLLSIVFYDAQPIEGDFMVILLIPLAFEIHFSKG
jgi:hypothetical protein